MIFFDLLSGVLIGWLVADVMWSGVSVWIKNNFDIPDMKMLIMLKALLTTIVSTLILFHVIYLYAMTFFVGAFWVIYIIEYRLFKEMN